MTDKKNTTKKTPPRNKRSEAFPGKPQHGKIRLTKPRAVKA